MSPRGDMFRFDPPPGSALRSLMMVNSSNGTSVWAGMTPWMRFVAFVGVPAVIALGVVWSDREQLVTRLDAQGAVIESIKDEARLHYDRDHELNQAILEATRETNRIVLAECLNNAKRNPNANEAWDRCIGR